MKRIDEIMVMLKLCYGYGNFLKKLLPKCYELANQINESRIEEICAINIKSENSAYWKCINSSLSIPQITVLVNLKSTIAANHRNLTDAIHLNCLLVFHTKHLINFSCEFISILKLINNPLNVFYRTNFLLVFKLHFCWKHCCLAHQSNINRWLLGISLLPQQHIGAVFWGFFVI